MTVTVHAIPGDAKRVVVYCATCQGSRTIPLPMPASKLAEELDAFQKTHDHDHETR